MFGLRSPAHCAKAGLRFDGWDGLVTKTSLMVVRTFRPALGVFGAGTWRPPKKTLHLCSHVEAMWKAISPESLRPFLGRNPVNPQVPLMGFGWCGGSSPLLLTHLGLTGPSPKCCSVV